MTFQVTGRTVAASTCGCGKALGVHNKSGKCWSCGFNERLHPLPADFAQHALLMTYPELAKHYGVGVTTTVRWRKEAGIPSPFIGNKNRTPVNKRDLPPGFMELAHTVTRKALAARYNCSRDLIDRWCREAGITPRQAVVAKPKRFHLSEVGAGQAKRAIVVNNRDMSRAGQAADYLKPTYIPVHRASADGRPDQRGTHWRCGRLLLTDAEIVERALRRGWDPDGWKRLGNAA